MENSIFIVIFFGVLGLGVFVLMLISKRKRKLSESEEDFVRRQWRMVGRGLNPKNDILEADKLLDFVLGKYGYRGSLGEKLKQAKKLFRNLDGVWFAHKLRNKFAHEINFHPKNEEVKQALHHFKNALEDLKIRL